MASRWFSRSNIVIRLPAHRASSSSTPLVMPIRRCLPRPLSPAIRPAAAARVRGRSGEEGRGRRRGSGGETGSEDEADVPRRRLCGPPRAPCRAREGLPVTLEGPPEESRLLHLHSNACSRRFLYHLQTDATRICAWTQPPLAEHPHLRAHSGRLPWRTATAFTQMATSTANGFDCVRSLSRRRRESRTCASIGEHPRRQFGALRLSGRASPGPFWGRPTLWSRRAPRQVCIRGAGPPDGPR